MRILGSVVQAFVAPMLGVRQHAPDGRYVAGEFVGDHDTRLVLATSQHEAQKPFSCYLIAPLLNQNVEHSAVLVDGSPQPVALAANLEQHLVQMPLVAWLRSALAQVGRVTRAERVAPV